MGSYNIIAFLMECGICYMDNELVKTDCNHIFCSKCLSTWREIKNSCPVCRNYISYTTKVKNNANGIEKRVTRSMTKAKREFDFYTRFKELVAEYSQPGMVRREVLSQRTGDIINWCLKNYKIMPETIYNLILEILESDDYIIKNRNMKLSRLIEIKPYINKDFTINI